MYLPNCSNTSLSKKEKRQHGKIGQKHEKIEPKALHLKAG